LEAADRTTDGPMAAISECGKLNVTPIVEVAAVAAAGRNRGRRPFVSYDAYVA